MSNLHATAHRQTPARLRGFTLVELMITVAIVAILAAIALPAYQKQIRQSRESSAKSALLDLARREEIFYSTNNTYTLQMATLGYSSANISNNAIIVPSSTQAYYTLTVTAGTTPAASGTTATTFTASATPVAGSTQASDPCGTFTLNYLGVQTPSASSGGGLNCW